MAEVYKSGHLADHPDSYLDMMLRREINESWAATPVDFNVQGLSKAQEHVGLTPNDVIADIGCSSGIPILKAAKQTGVMSRIIGIEPDGELYDFIPPNVDVSRFTFITAVGEDIPLTDNYVKVSSAHNVLFRAHDGLQMLLEMQRITQPDGLLLISTNGRAHAFMRHEYEKVVARAVEETLGVEITPPPTPAEGFYLENMPEIIGAIPGLEIIDRVDQKSQTIITAERAKFFVLSIVHSVNRTSLADTRDSRAVWRAAVNRVISPLVFGDIEDVREHSEESGIDGEPFITDTVDRGMLVMRNTK